MNWTSILQSESPIKIAEFLRSNAIDIGIACGFDKLREYPHAMWLDNIIDGTEDYTLQAHRSSYKTTCLSIAIPIWMVTEPNSNTIFIRKTDYDVKEIIKQARKILMSDYMQKIAYSMYGHYIELLKDTEDEIDTNLKNNSRGASQLLGIGVGSSIQGKHSDRIVTDDIVNLKDRISAAERKKTLLYYEELHNIKSREGGRIINCCTPWHKEDATAKMPNIDKYDWIKAGLVTKDQAQELRGNMSPSMFSANYELQHIAAEDALFKSAPRFDNDEAKLYNGIAHIDAAYGGGDYTAFTCGKRTGDTIYMYGKMWSDHVDRHIQEIVAITKRLRCAPIYSEVNADKGYLAKELQRAGMISKMYSENMNKYQKISTYLYKWWPKIVWLEGTDPEYLNQIMDYTIDAAHDDSADGASCIARLLDKSERGSLI